jgi:hypothetical protein
MLLPAGELPSSTTKWMKSWVISILPYCEGSTLYNSFNFQAPISDPTNAVPRSMQLPVMLCPSDPKNGTNYNPFSDHAADGPNWARGNYAANGSVERINGNNMTGPQGSDWMLNYKRGVMGCNATVTIDDIRDGVANTIMLTEIRAGVVPGDRRGTWAMGAAGASSLWGHGVASDQGPNNISQNADGISECSEVQSALGGASALMQQFQMGCNSSNGNSQATARSPHKGGVSTCFCDGSIHFINDSIDHNTSGVINSTSDLHVWEKLNVIADGCPINQGSF